MTVATLTVKEFRTPRGRSALMAVRDGTSDHNNAYSCLTEDEYRLASVELGEGTALDIGAHIGGVTVALALDNPLGHVIAVEALSENVTLLRENVERNNVSDRVTILHSAADRPDVRSTVIEWDFDADESGQHHRFIGNGQGFNHEGSKRETVDAISLDRIVAEHGPIAFAKIDCELCEYDFLASPAVKDVALIRGEFHSGFERIVDLLGDTHHVTTVSGTEAFGGFEAVRR